MPYSDPEKRRLSARLRAAKYRVRHPDRVKESSRKWHAEHPDKSKECNRSYRENNKEKVRSYSQRKYRERVTFINAYKLEHGCMDCGYKAHPVALEFDHRDPKEKLFAISSRLNNSWESILHEIAKCDIRCANCHRIRTVTEKHTGGDQYS